MAEKTKKAEKSKKEKVCWTVEEEELLVELWPTYDCLCETNSPEFKVDKRQSAEKIYEENYKQSLKACSLVKAVSF